MKELTYSGEVLGNRYRILKRLGRSDRKTYLAEDLTHRNALLVLKEVANGQEGMPSPPTEKSAAKLIHPQIPRFRELFRAEDAGKNCVFWVEEYIKGKTYQTLLQNRRQQGRLGFSELEVTLLLLQILPILEYVHAQHVIHQHISPNSIILRNNDGLPVLVFGEPTTAIERCCSPSEPSRPHSDLYALGATSLVLLAGKEPQELFDPLTSEWNWQRNIVLSPHLTKVLQKMLAKPEKRFKSATEVVKALRQMLPQAKYPVAQSSVGGRSSEQTAIRSGPGGLEGKLSSPQGKARTQHPVSPGGSKQLLERTETASINAAPGPKAAAGCFSKAVLAIAVVVGPGIGGWFAGKAWLARQQATTSAEITTSQSPQQPPSKPPEPLFQRQQSSLERRRRSLGIEEEFFDELINWAFVQRYPSQRGRTPTKRAAEQEWQQRWKDIAADYLEQLKFLSAEARQGLGSYDRATSDRLTRAANRLYLSSRALYDLVDAEFFFRFPDQEQPLAQPLQQIWSAIALDKLSDLQSGDALEQIESDDSITRLRETLAPGEGQAYTIYLDASQVMDVHLLAGQDVLLSIYSPSGRVEMLEDSTARQWSGVLPESGYYEFTIVSQAKQPLPYRLTLSFASQLESEESPF